VTATLLKHLDCTHEQAGRSIATGYCLRRFICCKRVRPVEMRRRELPIEGSLQFRSASSCVLYNSGFILSAVATAIQPCSAVTSFATRWTEPPP
jgi:hypothetical protein